MSLEGLNSNTEEILMIYDFFQTELTGILIILGCIFLSAFFSSAETAITSLGILKVKHLLEIRGRAVHSLKLWLQHPGRVLTTILVFNNIVNILASSITTHITTKYVKSGAIALSANS